MLRQLIIFLDRVITVSSRFYLGHSTLTWSLVAHTKANESSIIFWWLWTEYGYHFLGTVLHRRTQQVAFTAIMSYSFVYSPYSTASSSAIHGCFRLREPPWCENASRLLCSATYTADRTTYGSSTFRRLWWRNWKRNWDQKLLGTTPDFVWRSWRQNAWNRLRVS